MRVVVGIDSYNSKDSTFTSAPSIHWTYVPPYLEDPSPPISHSANTSVHSYAEIVIGIICGCMPAVPKFLTYLVPKISSKLSVLRTAFLRRFPSLGSSRKALVSGNGEPHSPRPHDVLQLRSFTAGPGLATMVSNSFRTIFNPDESGKEDDEYQHLESGSAAERSEPSKLSGRYSRWVSNV